MSDMTIAEIGELIRSRYTERGYTVRVTATGAGWCVDVIDGEVVASRVYETLEHAIEALCAE